MPGVSNRGRAGTFWAVDTGAPSSLAGTRRSRLRYRRVRVREIYDAPALWSTEQLVRLEAAVLKPAERVKLVLRPDVRHAVRVDGDAYAQQTHFPLTWLEFADGGELARARIEKQVALAPCRLPGDHTVVGINI